MTENLNNKKSKNNKMKEDSNRIFDWANVDETDTPINILTGEPVEMELETMDDEWFERMAQNHPALEDCPDSECIICGWRECPHREPLHFHHDGCPACYNDEVRKMMEEDEQ